jgi:hypothetical protein
MGFFTLSLLEKHVHIPYEIYAKLGEFQLKYFIVFVSCPWTKNSVYLMCMIYCCFGHIGMKFKSASDWIAHVYALFIRSEKVVDQTLNLLIFNQRVTKCEVLFVLFIDSRVKIHIWCIYRSRLVIVPCRHGNPLQAIRA